MVSFPEFSSRMESLRGRIAGACRRAGRDPAGVELLAVTKTHPPAAIDYASRRGLRAIGENRVQEGVAKRPLVAPESAALRWELIGHLQSNKARAAVECFDRVQSVDREKLLRHLDRAAAEKGKTLAILLQVNAGHDPAKFGAEPEDAPRLLDAALALPNLRVDGLMTIAPLSGDPAVAERTFAGLREIRDRLAASRGVELRELSMGMTGDFEAAIAAGSTLLRVGAALYGERQ
ncbi:MAG: YggS family pyridoxal phosphate-dependent enzyme [Opitutaceae bacterium]|jgi:pyridoxal phosphate enzyme (YggS family)|nr:YggS family pyridoxal phosphate-dependent enzyme [Opitutaceae bacterium]